MHAMSIIRRIVRRRFVAALVAGFALWMLACGALAAVALSAGDSNTAQRSDAIVVLGAGLRRDGRPGDALWRRSLVAAQAYHAGLAPNVICTGGISERQTRSEADACREVLIGEDVPASAIVLEDASRSTEQNAINVKAIMAERGWRTAVIVTDSFHMLRAGWIFSGVGVEHTRFPVPRNRVRVQWIAMSMIHELAAIHWYAFKGLFGIPATDFPN
jgi:uncharacterized SAM-binding protein YcdF (DUF218 family)